MFENLLHTWQEKLNVNWSTNFTLVKLMQMKKCKFEKKLIVEDPTILMNLLNSQITNISANQKLATYLTADGNLFVMGRDFGRALSGQDLQCGIPRKLSVNQKVSEVVSGDNHVLILTRNG